VLVLETVGPAWRGGIGCFHMQAAPPPHEWVPGDAPQAAQRHGRGLQSLWKRSGRGFGFHAA